MKTYLFLTACVALVCAFGSILYYSYEARRREDMKRWMERYDAEARARNAEWMAEKTIHLRANVAEAQKPMTINFPANIPDRAPRVFTIADPGWNKISAWSQLEAMEREVDKKPPEFAPTVPMVFDDLPSRCGVCHGRGWVTAHNEATHCPMCEGHGEVRD